MLAQELLHWFLHRLVVVFYTPQILKLKSKEKELYLSECRVSKE